MANKKAQHLILCFLRWLAYLFAPILLLIFSLLDFHYSFLFTTAIGLALGIVLSAIIMTIPFLRKLMKQVLDLWYVKWWIPIPVLFIVSLLAGLVIIFIGLSFLEFMLATVFFLWGGGLVYKWSTLTQRRKYLDHTKP